MDVSVVSAIAAIARALALEAPHEFGREVLRVGGAAAVAARQDAPAAPQRGDHRRGRIRRRARRRRGRPVKARGLREDLLDEVGVSSRHQPRPPLRRRSFSMVARNCSSVTCVGASNVTGTSTCTG